MALEKRNEYRYEILENGVIQLRRSDIISEDGVDIATSYDRRIIAPGDDVLNESQEIQDLAAVVHTQARIDSYQAALAAEQA